MDFTHVFPPYLNPSFYAFDVNTTYLLVYSPKAR